MHRSWIRGSGWSVEKDEGNSRLGGLEGPCLGAAPRTCWPQPSLAPSLPSQLLLTTRTLVDGAGASEFPEGFRSQELRQVWGGGKPDPGRRGMRRPTGHRAGHGAARSCCPLYPYNVPTISLQCPCCGAVVIRGPPVRVLGCHSTLMLGCMGGQTCKNTAVQVTVEIWNCGAA